MNEVVLSGFSSLSEKDKDRLVDHVLVKDHWARLVNRKSLVRAGGKPGEVSNPLYEGGLRGASGSTDVKIESLQIEPGESITDVDIQNSMNAENVSYGSHFRFLGCS